MNGDSADGQALFFGKAGCSNCHSVRGQGGMLGPDLSEIGARRRLDQIREALVKPNDRITPGYRSVTLEAGDGSRLRAVAKNHTNYSAQLLDENGELHLLGADEAAGLRVENRSWMPADYESRLGEGGIQDLLAFLSRLSLRPEMP